MNWTDWLLIGVAWVNWSWAMGERSRARRWERAAREYERRNFELLARGSDPQGGGQ